MGKFLKATVVAGWVSVAMVFLAGCATAPALPPAVAACFDGKEELRVGKFVASVLEMNDKIQFTFMTDEQRVPFLRL